MNALRNDGMGTYEDLAIKSAAMVDAARRSDWNSVISIEQECSVLIGELKTQVETTPPNPESRHRKAQIIRRMLIEDAEIRDLAQPQLASLASLISLTNTRRRVENAYT